MVLRLILGAVYTAMAVGQLLSWSAMPGILSAYRLVPDAGLQALAAGLIAGELVAGVWFLTRPRSTALAPVWVYTAVSVVWAGLAGQTFARGLTVELCGCVGRYLGQRLSWIVLVEDALLLLYAALLLQGGLQAKRTARRALEPPAYEVVEPRRVP